MAGHVAAPQAHSQHPIQRWTRKNILLLRDITEIHSPFRVMFAADTTQAILWMRKHYGGRSIVFNLPAEQARAADFRDAAQANDLHIIVLKRQDADWP